jgi:hypothetical protein
MTEINPHSKTPAFRDAAHFWEPARLLYNAILTTVVLLWVALTWPHFRSALTLDSFEAFVVLGLLANLCYSAAYVAELVMQPTLPQSRWRLFRRALWVLGMLFALLLENYWIADEIYPYADQPPQAILGGSAMPAATIASNMNFPAPLAVLGFLAACSGLFLGLAAALIFWFARKPKFARVTNRAIAAGAVIYLALLLGFSAGSHTTTLARGQEKYFCEIDCHLAYSIVDTHSQPDGHYVITLRTRFDETTTSPNRPKDAPLTPSPREVRLIDSTGHEYTPLSTHGTPLLTPLKPADAYTTQLEFQLPKDAPKDATNLRLLINTTPAWPDHVVIGDENSFLHKKTYLAL